MSSYIFVFFKIGKNRFYLLNCSELAFACLDRDLKMIHYHDYNCYLLKFLGTSHLLHVRCDLYPQLPVRWSLHCHQVALSLRRRRFLIQRLVVCLMLHGRCVPSNVCHPPVLHLHLQLCLHRRCLLRLTMYGFSLPSYRCCWRRASFGPLPPW